MMLFVATDKSIIDLKLVNIFTYNMIRFPENKMCVCVCVCVCRCSVVSNSVNRIIHPNPSSILACMCLLSCFSHVQLSATLWTVAHQAPLCMGFSGQEYRSGLPGPSPKDLVNLGIEPKSPAAPALQVASSPLSCWRSPLHTMWPVKQVHRHHAWFQHTEVTPCMPQWTRRVCIYVHSGKQRDSTANAKGHRDCDAAGSSLLMRC